MKEIVEEECGDVTKFEAMLHSVRNQSQLPKMGSSVG